MQDEPTELHPVELRHWPNVILKQHALAVAHVAFELLHVLRDDVDVRGIRMPQHVLLPALIQSRPPANAIELSFREITRLQLLLFAPGEDPAQRLPNGHIAPRAAALGLVDLDLGLQGRHLSLTVCEVGLVAFLKGL